MENNKPKKKKFRVPHTYVILVLLVFIISVLSYIVPASNYDMMEVAGREVVDPNTFHYVDATPVSPLQFLTAFPRGLQEAAQISFFIFILGGAFEMINATQAMEVGVSNLAKKLQNVPHLIVPVMVIIFSLMGGTIGMSEETIIFVPIGIMLARGLGYDAMVGASMIFLGAACGFNSGFMNPFTVGVAQGIAEVPIFSGIGLRLIIWIVFNAVTIWYILRYAKKVKEDPSQSIVRDLEEKERHKVMDINNIPEFTTVHKLVLTVFVLGLILIIYGVTNWDFYIDEISAIFLGMAIIASIIGRINPNDMATNFIRGAADIATGALVVGIARAILVVMNDGQILYTIVHGISNIIQFLPKSLAAVMMFLFQLVLNFFIPSGSGQAAATMPIMVPLADLLGITRQTAVLAFHLGDGISNSIIPTGGSLLAAISVANIKYEEWAKFAGKIVGIWVIIGVIFSIIAVAINYA